MQRRRLMIIATSLTLLSASVGLSLARTNSLLDDPDCSVSDCTFLPLILKNASEITALPSATPTAFGVTVSPTAEPSLTATDTPLPTNTPTDLPTATSVPTNTPTDVPTATSVPTSTPTDVPTATSVPTNTPTDVPTATSVPTNTPTATNIPSNTPTETSTPTNTATATSTTTATPRPPTTTPTTIVGTATPTTPANFTRIVWSTAVPTPFSYPFGAVEAQGAVVGGKLYVFGGFGQPGLSGDTPSRLSNVYDPVANTWTAIAPLERGLTHVGTATDGQKIFFVGGYIEDFDGVGQIFGSRVSRYYDTATNSYTNLPVIPLQRAAGQLYYLDRKLHYVGGTYYKVNDVGTHFVLDLNNLATGWVTQTNQLTYAELPNPRQHAGGVVLDGKLYYIGGQHGHDGSLTVDNDVHRYDPATNAWEQLADIPLALNHISHSTVVLGGKIFVFAGQTTNGTKHNTIYVYNPATNTWAQMPNNLPATRYSGIIGEINGTLYFTTGGGTTSYRGIPTP
ncbi:kelch repeat-containing protein [Herpetosiphon giganteus]|uniref:kelch repeat-containing protein n=1 Tax=Herpetosiphon giganteus TaxID=2029754 RepID=UPI0019592177|nr:kelch repeat-containing protein [Herpetosiphon giganteus]MBM7842813.1 N-acetylneuraminic acid mutarotase [Herpetosiphon giganteus]